jgi:hypothetical protein
MPAAVLDLNRGALQPPYDPSNPAGSATSVNPAQFAIVAGELEMITGPTIPAAETQPLIVQMNSVAPNGFSASDGILLNGPPGHNIAIEIDGYAGLSGLTFRRQDGTAAAPTAVQAGDECGLFQALAYTGTGTIYATIGSIEFDAIENISTTAHGGQYKFNLTPQGSTVAVNALLLTGATGQKRVQVTGGLSIDQAGTFIATGATAVTIAATGVTANSVVICSVNTAGGTVGNAPHVGMITPGTNFTMIANALDTSTYNYVIIN